MNATLRRGLRIVGWTCAVLIVGAAIVWFGVPSFRMYRFEAALTANDYDAAAAMIGGPIGPARAKDFHGMTFDVAPATWQDVLTGRRYLSVRATYVDGKLFRSGRTYWATPFFLSKDGC